jgi:hypothetical protein
MQMVNWSPEHIFLATLQLSVSKYAKDEPKIHLLALLKSIALRYVTTWIFQKFSKPLPQKYPCADTKFD